MPAAFFVKIPFFQKKEAKRSVLKDQITNLNSKELVGYLRVSLSQSSRCITLENEVPISTPNFFGRKCVLLFSDA